MECHLTAGGHRDATIGKIKACYYWPNKKKLKSSFSYTWLVIILVLV